MGTGNEGWIQDHSEGLFPGLDVGVCSAWERAGSMRERESLQLRYLDDSETTSGQGDNSRDPILTAERYLAKGEAKIRQGILGASVRNCCTLRHVRCACKERAPQRVAHPDIQRVHRRQLMGRRASRARTGLRPHRRPGYPTWT